MEIGIDIVSIFRIENSFRKYREKFLKKILTQEEINIINSISNNKRKVEKLAGIFAAKEAIIKCLNKKVSFKEISISYMENGKPYCKINNLIIKLSISHEKNYAVAFAILDDGGVYV